jgi:hypothetical protein
MIASSSRLAGHALLIFVVSGDCDALAPFTELNEFTTTFGDHTFAGGVAEIVQPTPLSERHHLIWIVVLGRSLTLGVLFGA